MEDAAPTSPGTSAVVATSTSASDDLTALEHLDTSQIRKAVEALLAHCKARKSKNALLLNESENLFLLVVLWKIPSKELRVKLSLPHSIRSDLAEICLFTKDELESPEDTERFYRKLLKKHGIESISRIIPFHTLKTEYKAYEAKLRLLGSFDIFLTDERIRRMLPTHIGRHFYQRKKVPVPVNLLAKNLSKEINYCLGGTVLNISKSGSCSTVRIGNTAMEPQHITENIVAVAEKLALKLPQKWQSVKLLFVKTERSASLPIFSSFVSCVDENSPLSFSGLQRQEKKKREMKVRKKQKKKNKRLRARIQKSASILPWDQAPQIGDDPVKATESHKNKKGKVKGQPKVTGKVKSQPTVTDDSEEDKIPQLVPIEGTPAKENVQLQSNASGKKSSKKSVGPSTSVVRKRKALPTGETPGKAPGKKQKTDQKDKERGSGLGKKDLRQTPKKPEAKFFTTHKKSGSNDPATPKQGRKNPSEGQAS
ncbi:ribosomal L1 domain-containing protein 1 [Perognathus longimembris pacificus]|uniref:ribosomal L1 domain-containing protein 1 n=1 Tax=Perognathus longimembris pacificus TaxID=214514 RepID=UPI002019245A|nr:ribosomal L1 domain-containing protein 1 [Perognathus longimembris pacificus]